MFSRVMVERYRPILDQVGAVPPPLVLFSASPGLQALQSRTFEYYMAHPNLSPKLKTLIRYLVAVALNMPLCAEFNAHVLEKLGMTREQVAELTVNPAFAPLEEKEGWLLAFVVSAVRDPDGVSESHVANLRDLGWSDSDIFDALNLAALMKGSAVLMKAFKFDE